ncbi:MAG: DUF6391 domain-containing protein [Thermoanaerobacteraceae bacterium]|nr:DUF6391 domain-containing protein [Thermoanaerobacteraceae bacterium]
MYFLLLLFFPIIIFLTINILFLLLQFTLRSFFSIITIPGEIIKIAMNKQLRRNHALEHATINVIEETYSIFSLSGIADENGFAIRGNVGAELVENAARVGLKRMKSGECRLAIHKRCGTTIAITNFAFSLIFLILILKFWTLTILNVITAMFLANLSGPILGSFVQKYFTTSCDVKDIDIASVRYRLKPIPYFSFELGFYPKEVYLETINLY